MTKLSRRDLGWVVARAAAVAGGQEFFSGWLGAAETHSHSQAPPELDRWSKYQPQFFSPGEYQAIAQFSEILIPSDDTPGAREAHVTPFIDFVVFSAAEYAPEMQTEWRRAMAYLKAQNFGQLSPDRQLALVTEMSAPERDRAKKHEGFGTYRLLKDMTLRAFYTSRVGLVEVLEYKGNAYLTEFPACTHPEHRKV